MESPQAFLAKSLAIDGMAASYGQQINENLKGMWLELLEPYSVEQVKQGVIKVIEEYQYKTLPPFAVLKEAIIAGDELPIGDQADVAWANLMMDIRKYGRYQEPLLPSTTDSALQAMGGWGVACQWRTDDLDRHRRTFCDLWKSHDSAAKKTAKALPSAERSMEKPELQPASIMPKWINE